MGAAVEVVGASVASKTTTAGAGLAGLGWWFSSEAAVAVGILLGVVGFFANVYFQRRRDKRDAECKLKDEERKQREEERREAEHRALMRAYEGKCSGQ